MADFFSDPARKLRGNSRILVASVLRGVSHELGGNDNEIQSGWNKDTASRGTLFVQDPSFTKIYGANNPT